jgi:hypothetical protein
MKTRVFSHGSGEKRVPEKIQKELREILNSSEIKVGKKTATGIREKILEKLCAAGWSKEAQISPDSAMTITSIKSGCGLCLQTGNTSRMYADILKLQKLYLENLISSAAIILPSLESAKILGSNIANASRLAAELEIFRKIIHVPILIYAFE